MRPGIGSLPLALSRFSMVHLVSKDIDFNDFQTAVNHLQELCAQFSRIDTACHLHRRAMKITIYLKLN